MCTRNRCHSVINYHIFTLLISIKILQLCIHLIIQLPCRKKRSVILDYVSHFYRRESYEASFSVPINSVPRKKYWTVPESYTSLEVRPPIRVRLPGRPRNSRVRGPLEQVRRRGRPPKRCLHCNDISHVTRVCPNVSP